jgi:hypothetical protein
VQLAAALLMQMLRLHLGHQLLLLLLLMVVEGSECVVQHCFLVQQPQPLRCPGFRPRVAG